MSDKRQALIPGGCILLARKLRQNGIFESPHLYLKLWVWMLFSASFKDHGELKRGQFFTSLEKMRDAMAYKVGFRPVKPTVKEIRAAMKFLTKHHMIGTMRVTHGTIVTIINYNIYQEFKSYEGHTEGQSEGHTEGTILRTNVRTNEKDPAEISEKISELKSRYSDQETLERALEAIASTRKGNKISDSVTLQTLQAWGKYPVEAVLSGIRIYLSKGFAAEGKDEKYLIGIIRKEKPRPAAPKATPVWY